MLVVENNFKANYKRKDKLLITFFTFIFLSLVLDVRIFLASLNLQKGRLAKPETRGNFLAGLKP